MIVSVFIILSGSAFAEGSLYKAGNISIGGGYSASNYNISNVTANGGFMVQTSYFITDNWAIQGKYYSNSLNGAGAGVKISENIMAISVDNHEAITDNFGVYASFGYGNGSFVQPTLTTSGGGLALALGVEYKFTSNVLLSLGYRSFFLSNAAISTGKYMNDGFDIGLNVVL